MVSIHFPSDYWWHRPTYLTFVWTTNWTMHGTYQSHLLEFHNYCVCWAECHNRCLGNEILDLLHHHHHHRSQLSKKWDSLLDKFSTNLPICEKKTPNKCGVVRTQTSASSNNSLHSKARDSEYFSLSGEKSSKITRSFASRTTSNISVNNEK